MKAKEYPIFTMLLCTVAAWALVELTTSNDKLAIMAAIATFVYSVYLGSIYAENGKQAMMAKLKEHALRVFAVLIPLVVSVWVTGVVSGWLGVESLMAKFGICMMLMVAIAYLEGIFIARKR